MFGLCSICGGDDLNGGHDGFFYCSTCGSQSQQFQEQAMDMDELAGFRVRRLPTSIAPPPAAAAGGGGGGGGDDDEEEAAEVKGNAGGASGKIHGLDDLDPSLPQAFLQTGGFPFDSDRPWELDRFPSKVPTPRKRGLSQIDESRDPFETIDQTADAIRCPYIEGFQEIIQILCQAMVEEFKVSPAICGIVAPIWLRYLAFTGIYDKAWPKEVIQIEEAKAANRTQRNVAGLTTKKKRKKTMPEKKRSRKRGKKNEVLEEEEEERSKEEGKEVAKKNKKKRKETSKLQAIQEERFDTEACRGMEPKPDSLLNVEIDEDTVREEKEGEAKDKDLEDKGELEEKDGETNTEGVKPGKEKDGETDTEDVKAKTERLCVRIRLLVLYLQTMRARLPLSVSLAIVFLACHIAREAILPTDIVNWALDGSLPFLTAFQTLGQKAGVSWPLSPRMMFKPHGVLGAKRLEFMAALIAKRIDLDLPPVNFHAISSRLLTRLNLPADKLSIHMSRMYDWYTPPGLWLSTEHEAFPTRVYVMAMMVIVLRALYKFDGRWDQGTSAVKPDRDLDPWSDKGKRRAETQTGPASSMDAEDDTWNVKHLLEMLETSWQDRGQDCFDLQRDLGPYLKYCQDQVFPNLDLEREEEYVCEQLRKLYERLPDKELPKEQRKVAVPDIQSLSGRDSHFSFKDISSFPMDIDTAEASTFANDDTSSDDSTHKKPEEGIEESKETSDCKRFRSRQQLVHDMTELGFAYLPPRQEPLSSATYLRYSRTTFFADACRPQVLHADYFILLCACAKVIFVQPIALFLCVWLIENHIFCIKGSRRSRAEGKD